MKQMHKRFTAEQVRVLLKGYCQGTLDRLAIEEILGIGKTRFFALLRNVARTQINLLLRIREAPRKGYLLGQRERFRRSSC